MENTSRGRKRNHSEVQKTVNAGERETGRVRSLNEESHFDKLPEEAITNIVRFTSERPRHENWVAHVSPKVAIALLESFQVLAVCCRDLFSSLAVRESQDIDKSTMSVIRRDEQSLFEWTRLLTLLNGDLAEIEILCKVSPAWIQALSSSFSNVDTLQLFLSYNVPGYSLPEILSGHRGNLQYLDIFQRSLSIDDNDAIAALGNELKALHLDVNSAGPAINKVWESTGKGLEEISISRHMDISSIRKNCKNLKEISVKLLDDDRHGELEELCKSLGENLKFMSISNCKMDAARLGRIANACISVALNVEEMGGCSSAALCKMGPNACFADIGSNTSDDAGHLNSLLNQAGKRCKNLVGIYMRECNSEHLFRAFLAHPKTLLKEFTGYFDELFDAYVVFDVLANKTPSLEKLKFSGTLPSYSVLHQFIDGTPMLKTVVLTYLRDICFCGQSSRSLWPDDAEESNPHIEFGTVANIFLQSRNLRRLCITCDAQYQPNMQKKEDYENALWHAWNRNVDVRICGYQYL